jgi:hypothetical protein
MIAAIIEEKSNLLFPITVPTLQVKFRAGQTRGHLRLGTNWEEQRVFPLIGGRACLYGWDREYWMIIEGQAFSPSYDLAPPAPPPSLPSVNSTGDTQEDWERDKFLTGRQVERGAGGRGATSYYHKKTWPSGNHSKLSRLWPAAVLRQLWTNAEWRNNGITEIPSALFRSQHPPPRPHPS